MNMPGFTADVCLNDQREVFEAQHYQMADVFADSAVARVLPQACVPDPKNPGRYCCVCWGKNWGCNLPYRYC